MAKPSTSFFVMNLILLFVITGFILIVFDLQRFAFVIELTALLVFIFLLAFGMFVVYNNKKWGWTILGAALILLLVNTFFIFLLTRTFETAHMTTIFFSVVGLVVTFLNLRPVQEELESQTEGDEKSKEYYPYIDKIEPEETSTIEANVEKTFTPGKFIASSKANKFHSPKCDWAKRISKENHLWFNSKEEAEARGFEADKCVS